MTSFHRCELWDWEDSFGDVSMLEAACNYAMNDTQRALRDLDTFYDILPQDTLSIILKARAALKVTTKDYAGALVDLDKAHRLDPDDDFTRGMRKALRQNSQQYLNAVANLLAEVVNIGTTCWFLEPSQWERIIGSFEDLSSRISFLLELTKIILQIWTCYSILVTFIFKYLMGYVERGQWGTYSNGSWEFRASYVCIELRLGAYPFQKFRDVAPTSHHDRTQISQPTRHLPGEPPKYHGVCRRRRRKGKQRPREAYEARESLKRDKLKRIYLGEYHTLEEAVLIRDVAHFCLGKQGPFNVDPVLYASLVLIPQGHSQQQIRKLVLERVKGVDRLAFKEKFETQEIMAEYGFPPTSYYLHSNQQASQDDDAHLGDDDIDELDSYSGEDSIISEPLPVPQDGVSSQHEITTIAEVLMSNNLSAPNESPDLHAATERIGVAHPTCTDFQMINDPNPVHSHESTRASNDRAQDVGVVGNTLCSTNLPYMGPTSSSNELWARQIVIKAPVGTTLLQQNGTQELVYSPTLICALSALQIFGVENWTMVPPCAFTGQSRGVCPDMSNGREGTRESCEYVFRIQKSGSPEELGISDSIRAALDKFRDLTGWIPWY